MSVWGVWNGANEREIEKERFNKSSVFVALLTITSDRSVKHDKEEKATTTKMYQERNKTAKKLQLTLGSIS